MMQQIIKFYDFLPEDFYQVNKDQLMYMWHFLSDKDIAELYDISAKKVKNRRHDFNIKPVTSAIDRIERELYGREDWLEEELKSVLPFEYNNGNIPHTNSTPLNSEKEFLYMKATGIVRRIEEYGIIGQKSKNPHKHYGFQQFLIELNLHKNIRYI